MANKKRRCLYCKEYTEAESGIKAPVGFFCSSEHLHQYALEKGRKRYQKAQNKEIKERKQKLKSYAEKMRELQDVFNKLRRVEEFLWFQERGVEPYCISCQKPLGNDQWCNGHFKTTKARPDLRFDKMNSYLQHNVRCNRALSGDIEGYKRGLKIRFGKDAAREIIEYCDTVKPTDKLSDDQIEQLKKDWRQQIREIEKNLK